MFHFIKKGFIYLFLETGKGREKGEKYQSVVTSNTSPTGDLAHNPVMYPRVGTEPVTL